MPDDESEPVNLDEPPSVDLPSADDFVAEQVAVQPVEGLDAGTATDLGWEFCLRYNGNPWQTMRFRADAAAEAAGWAQAYTRFANNLVVAMGYPPLCTWTAGACRVS